ncbi:MAG: cytochrome c-type biogenesis protein [Steroidobacteraceae bacterium]
MKRSLAPLLLLCLLAPMTVLAVDPHEMSDPALQQRYKALTTELRCMQCQNQSIADSQVGLADDLRRQVRELLEAGKSDDDIRDYMVARYGEFILFRPRFSLRNAWLWLAPLVLLLIGAIAAVRVIRHRNRLLPDDATEVSSD